MRVDLDLISVGVRLPLRPETAPGPRRPLVLVTVRDADGLEGYGEAAPLEQYDSVSVERVLLALRMYMPRLVNADADSREQLLATCANVDRLPQALAAIDMALWDLAARRAGVPLWSLLAGGGEAPGAVPGPEPLPVNATIGSVSPESAAREAADAVADGFGCVKVKVGTPDDERRLEAVRAAVGPEVLIRVDANGAWSEWDAAEHLRALARFEIELFEEPVHGAEQLAALALAVPDARVAADETARAVLAPPAKGEDAEPRRCDAVCLKVASSGGVSGLLRDARAARALGYEVYFASTLDGPLGIATALHVAAAVRPDRACGLATLGRFDEPVPEALVPVGGHMRVPPGAGLGDDLAAWYA